MKKILILFIFSFSSNFVYSNGANNSSNGIPERTLDEYISCAAFYVEFAAMAKATKKNQFLAFSSSQAEKALDRAIDKLGEDKGKADALQLLESKLEELKAKKTETKPVAYMRFLKDTYFKSCERVLNDSSKPIIKQSKWADEEKCNVYINGVVSPYLPLLASMYNQKYVNNLIVKEHIISSVNRGCDVNKAAPTGLSALNAGIYFNEPDIVELMLNLGASPNLRILRPGDSSGPNSFEFLEILNNENRSRKEIELLLKKKHITNQ